MAIVLAKGYEKHGSSTNGNHHLRREMLRRFSNARFTPDSIRDREAFRSHARPVRLDASSRQLRVQANVTPLSQFALF